MGTDLPLGLSPFSGPVPAWRSALITAALIALAPLLLLVNCWNAPFLPYDDVWHIFDWFGPSHPSRTGSGEISLARLFLLPQPDIYIPLTLLSYRLDSLLFPWMYERLGTWAPGVRLMTCVYHAGAALLVWRIVGLLGLSRGKALFVALAFAIHPTACETVCWAAERKNALAGLFGFASIWAFLRFDGRKRQMPLAALFYLLALWSKPSALGILPVLLLADLYGGVLGSEAPWRRSPPSPCGRGQGEGGAVWRSPRYWLRLCWRFLPFILLSGGAVIMNTIGVAKTLVPPPGGNVFTAILTDAEVLSRYLYNVFAPVGLSIAYFVAPITSPLELRFWGYAAVLATICVVTVWLAPNRRLALFGWLWFVLALGPSLNLISIASAMQDRYIYLSLPGILLVGAESFSGLVQRVRLDRRLHWAAAVPSVAMLALLGVARGALFGNLYLLFEDGVRKQPLSATAHHGLSVACAQACAAARKQKRWAEMDAARHRCGRELQYIIDHCPDATRRPDYPNTAYEAGEYALVLKNAVEAERYFRLVLDGPPWLSVPKSKVIEALARLTEVKLGAGEAEEAYEFACRAVDLSAVDGAALLARSAAALALADTTRDQERGQEWRRQAENDLEFVPQSSTKYTQAQKMLRTLREQGEGGNER